MNYRTNAVTKLKFLYPDIEMILNTQSAVFFGYSKSSKVLISGEVNDRHLPNIMDLEEKLKYSDFRDFAEYFSSDLRNPVGKGSYRGFSSPEIGDGFSYLTFTPIEIKLLKNGRIFARSSFFRPSI